MRKRLDRSTSVPIAERPPFPMIRRPGLTFEREACPWGTRLETPERDTKSQTSVSDFAVKRSRSERFRKGEAFPKEKCERGEHP